MELKDIGINPDLGGAVLVTYGTIVEHRSYTGKDNKTKFVTDLVYMGGNQSVATPSDHPIRAKGEGELVLIAQNFQENRFGWKAIGFPVMVETPVSETTAPAPVEGRQEDAKAKPNAPKTAKTPTS